MAKCLGIVAGMGPLSSARLHTSALRSFQAPGRRLGDKDYPRVILHTVRPEIAVLPPESDEFVNELEAIAALLVAQGADAIAIPCNAAHAIVDRLQRSCPRPILNMVQLTVNEVVRRGFKSALVLATAHTRRSGMYDAALTSRGVRTSYPHHQEQIEIDEAIEQLASGEAIDRDAFARLLASHQVDCLLLGCTELSLAFNSAPPWEMIDSLECLVSGIHAALVGDQRSV